MTQAPDIWADTLVAMVLVALDPSLGGVALRARAGPVREALVAEAKAIARRPVRRVPPGVEDARLLGGLDLTATLSAGRPVMSVGLLGEVGGGTLVLPMAERMGGALAARISLAMDQGIGFAVLALDEGAEPEEAMPAGLRDRLAFWSSLEGVRRPGVLVGFDMARAAERLAAFRIGDGDAALFVEAAAALGIPSLRAPLLALRAARAKAALDGDAVLTEAAVRWAARMVLGPRALRMPEVDEEIPDAPPPPEAPPETPEEEGAADKPLGDIPKEVLLEAVAANLPADVLARLAAGGALRPLAARGAGAGGEIKGSKRGRPAGSVRGDVRGAARLDLIGTLRAAAPWQPIRRRMQPDAPARVLVRADDVRVRRYSEALERIVIFVVDASGSSALGRLAEAKGAIELMLGEAYVRREDVALIAFRGESAEILLPPTRSLVQTKRRLAGLPGGGGTPLAAGLEAALALADQCKRRGQMPALVFLTDGKANIARDGAPGRAQASEDALAVARAVRTALLPSIVIDTSQRPQTQAADLAAALGGTYLPLPRADARGISRSVDAALVG